MVIYNTLFDEKAVSLPSYTLIDKIFFSCDSLIINILAFIRIDGLWIISLRCTTTEQSHIVDMLISDCFENGFIHRRSDVVICVYE